MVLYSTFSSMTHLELILMNLLFEFFRIVFHSIINIWVLLSISPIYAITLIVILYTFIICMQKIFWCGRHSLFFFFPSLVWNFKHCCILVRIFLWKYTSVCLRKVTRRRTPASLYSFRLPSIPIDLGRVSAVQSDGTRLLSQAEVKSICFLLT